MKKHARIIGRARLFWESRRVTLRILIEVVGRISMVAFSTVLSFATIVQWFFAEHIIVFRWNVYGEALPEFVFALITVPCMLYTFKVNVKRLVEKWHSATVSAQNGKRSTDLDDSITLPS